jgi:hypothetical protein
VCLQILRINRQHFFQGLHRVRVVALQKENPAQIVKHDAVAGILRARNA